MLREVALASLALSGAALAASPYKLEARDGAAHGAHGHDHGHDHGHAPAATHHTTTHVDQTPAASSGSYGSPSVSSDSYGSPSVSSSSYGSPSTGYADPAPSYGGVSTGYAATEETLPDFTPIIIGLLVLTGLSLLFPTYVSLSSVRRKRETDEDVSPMSDVMERVNDIYTAVVNSEECMERVACEIGGLAADFGLQENKMAKIAGGFVPHKYKTFYKQFTSGKNCHKIQCGSLAF